MQFFLLPPSLLCFPLPVREDACISVMQLQRHRGGESSGAGFLFFFYIQGGWLDGMKEKSEGARAQPRGVFDYQASKRPTFTDSFPLWALSIPHS